MLPAAGARLEVRPVAPLSPIVRAGVKEVGRRLGRFLEQPVEFIWIEDD